MVRVSFAASLIKHTHAAPTDVDAASVREALNAVFVQFPGLRGYVLDDQNHVRQHVTIFINNQTISDRFALNDRLADGDEVYVFQALSGG